MPPIAIERKVVQQIADEFEELANTLRSYPRGAGGPRTGAPARAILAALKRINATLSAGARKGKLGRTGFTSLGRQFDRIATTLLAVGSGSKTARTTRKTTRRKATRKTTRR